MISKSPKESLIIMTELVLPNDTNIYGNLMGGRLMYWMDIAAALCAGKHCNAPVVTASVDNISFENPIRLGNAVHIEARVSRAFTSSMEVHLSAWGEDLLTSKKYKSNEAYYTFVRIDAMNKPQPVPALTPETEADHLLYAGGPAPPSVAIDSWWEDETRRGRRTARLILRGEVVTA